MASLVDTCLLRQDEAAGEPRFRMLEAIREYALECLTAAGEADRFQRAHADCYLELAGRAESGLLGGEHQAEWLDRLNKDHDNLRAALAWFVRHGPADDGLRLAGALRRFWRNRGYSHDRKGRARSMGRRVLALLLFATCVADTVRAAELVLGPRQELVHQVKPPRVRALPAAIAVGRDGVPLAAWITQDGGGNDLHVARVTGTDPRPVRVNPDGMVVDSLYQPPGVAVGPGGEVYVSWSSRRYGGAYGSTLRLSRSLDGGQTFDGHLGVNEDRPVSHSFEGLAVGPDGTVLVSWIDSRDNPDTAATYVARIIDRGARVASAVRLDTATCACCRVSVAAGRAETVVAAWRRVLPGDIRDIVAGVSRDHGRTFPAATLVHDDRWKITACPRRGPSVAIDGRGRVYSAWYTEGPDGQPKILLSVAPDGARFGGPVRVNASASSIPDHPRLAVAPAGIAVVVWAESTAVRHRVLMRYSTDGGRTLSPARALSEIVKESASDPAPDIAVTPHGGFIVAWHEERSSSVKTVVQPLRVETR